MRLWICLVPSLLALGSFGLRAQDLFEIQVYEYETVPKRMWNLETHTNYIARGTKHFEGTVAPENNQFHLTYELTHGITKYFEMAGYLVLAKRPGVGDFLEFVGWRVRPRVRLPESWLPVKISISGEVGFPRKVFEENSMTLEIRPIVEKNFGRLQLDFNPVFGRALRGPGKSEGWEFEPAVRFAYELTKKFTPSLEYYGSTGPITGFFPSDEQVHVLYPGFDLNINDRIVWNVGVGMAATPAGNSLTFKMRLGVLFGKQAK